MLLRRVFDAHADSAVLPDLDGEGNQLRLSDIYDYDGYTQVFAVCMEVDNPKEYAREKIDAFLKMIKSERLALVRGAEDLDAKYAAVLALEGADAIDTLSALDFFTKRACG
ncbi:MAG: hypothetical protein LUG52_09905 [Clostridia bacterium]|nr:hypothetical protein [Clostridia bacterium]